MDRLQLESIPPRITEKTWNAILAKYLISERHIYGKKHTVTQKKAQKRGSVYFPVKTKNMRESNFWHFLQFFSRLKINFHAHISSNFHEQFEFFTYPL